MASNVTSEKHGVGVSTSAETGRLGLHTRTLIDVGGLLASSYCTVIQFNIMSSLGLEGLASCYDN
jgi:hypothetical protein